MKSLSAAKKLHAGNGRETLAERRFIDELRGVLPAFTQASDAAVGISFGAGVQWMTTAAGCVCSQKSDGAPACLDRRAQPERSCHPMDLGARPESQSRLLLCCRQKEKNLPRAVNQLIKILNYQLELERGEEQLLDELSSSWESLEAVYEISSDIGLLANPQEQLDRIVYRASSFRTGLKAILWLDRDGTLDPLAKGLPRPEPRPKGSGLLERAMTTKGNLIFNGRARIAEEIGVEPELRKACNLAIIPLVSRTYSLGALVVWQEEETHDFDTHHIRFLSALALQAAMALENDRLHRASLESERLRQEVEIGSEIQQTLLLGQAPGDFPGLQVAAFSAPSQMIDGDFLDFIKPNDQCLDVITGDVMGKGIPAALVGAATKSHFLRAMSQMLSSSAPRRLPEPHEIVSFVHNEVVKQLITLESFVTLCYARFDLNVRQVTIVDCGHTRTVRYRPQTGHSDLLKGGNMPLGFIERDVYQQFSFEMEPGDLFFFYSDGLTEAVNERGEPFGEERLVELIASNNQLTVDALVHEIHASVNQFAGGLTLTDDLTCVAVRIMKTDYSRFLRQAEVEFTSSPRNLGKCRELVRRVCDETPQCGMDETFISQLELAVNEAVANVIEHA
jgi:serine phosphatase RsbU (regulator of sigma subunit)